MMTVSDTELENLDELMSLRDESGRVVLQAALVATLYFKDAYTAEKREAVVECCEYYAQLCGDRLRWAMDPDIGLMAPFPGAKGANPRGFLLATKEDEPFGVVWSSAEHDRGAGAFWLMTEGAERRPYTKLDYFKIALPISWLTQGREPLPSIVRHLAATLKAASGYAGISIVESWEMWSRFQPYVYYWAMRFPGLEADYPTSHSIWLPKGREGGKEGIKGVNWLTVVGDHLLAELGGADVVTDRLRKLDERFMVHRYEGGVVIQAGERPVLGDAERGSWPELYVKLSKFLKPIRISEHRPFQYAGDGERFDLERSQAWLRRFDDR
ncbi:MAG TPA: type VI immunity family protein [Candidatus Nanopelagicales bacterium]|nr:type VI immunity family protein [Candidatus Nanopelagicales bacterium]